MKNETPNFYQEMMSSITHHSEVIINPNIHYNNITNLRVLYAKTEKKIQSAIQKGISEDREIEAKETLVTIAVTIQYLEELFLKSINLEKKIMEHQIINLNLLQSNRAKENKITDLLNRI